MGSPSVTADEADDSCRALDAGGSFFCAPTVASFVNPPDADALRDRIERRLSVRFIWGFVVVFLGGGFGAALRHGINLAAVPVSYTHLRSS